jgi:hypothetical protein
MIMRSKIAVAVALVLLGFAALWLLNRVGNETASAPNPTPATNVASRAKTAVRVPNAPGRITRVPRTSRGTTAPLPERDALMEQLLRATDERTISKTLRTAIGIEAERTYARRIKAMHELPHDLAPKAVEVLQTFLQIPYSKESGLREIEHEALRNDAMEKLVRQDRMPEGLGTLLVRMYRDPKQGDVWRDYCVQFFSTYYERKWRTDDADAGGEERVAILEAFEDAMRETDKTIAGTALLGMDRLATTYGEFDRSAIASNAVSLAANDGAFAPIRATALLVCEQHGMKEVLPIARMLAQTGENTHLRMVAVKTLGVLGEKEDRELLTAMTQDSDTNVAVVAAMALARNQAR